MEDPGGPLSTPMSQPFRLRKCLRKPRRVPPRGFLFSSGPLSPLSTRPRTPTPVPLFPKAYPQQWLRPNPCVVATCSCGFALPSLTPLGLGEEHRPFDFPTPIHSRRGPPPAGIFGAARDPFT